MMNQERLEEAVKNRPHSLTWPVVLGLKKLGFNFKKHTTKSFKVISYPSESLTNNRVLYESLFLPGFDLYLWEDPADPSLLHKKYVKIPQEEKNQSIPLSDNKILSMVSMLSDGACPTCGKLLTWSQSQISVGTVFNSSCCGKGFCAITESLKVSVITQENKAL